MLQLSLPEFLPQFLHDCRAVEKFSSQGLVDTFLDLATQSLQPRFKQEFALFEQAQAISDDLAHRGIVTRGDFAFHEFFKVLAHRNIHRSDLLVYLLVSAYKN